MLDAVTATPVPTSPLPPVRSLDDRDEYGPITGRPGGLFTAAGSVLLGERDELGRRLADWVPADHLLSGPCDGPRLVAAADRPACAVDLARLAAGRSRPARYLRF